MCTAVNYKAKSHFFGRNLDLERSYGECVVITPRNFRFEFRCATALRCHHAMIGMATVVNGYPLYYEATNEKGVSIAGLRFPVSACYGGYAEGKLNLAPFELIPQLLGCCGNMEEVRQVLSEVNLTSLDFSPELPASPLHWLISWKDLSIVVEPRRDGLKIYDAPLGILTNEPPYDYHTANLLNYISLHSGALENRLLPRESLAHFSLGSGTLGLPGDYSSASRFVRAVFVKESSPVFEREEENLSQFFHILDAVSMPIGCVSVPSGGYEYTRYSCCCNTDRGIYYYKTYFGEPKAVNMEGELLDGVRLLKYGL